MAKFIAVGLRICNLHLAQARQPDKPALPLTLSHTHNPRQTIPEHNISLKFGLTGPSGEWNDVSYVVKPSGEQHQAFEPQAKSGVRYAAVLSEINVRFVVGQIQAISRKPLLEHL